MWDWQPETGPNATFFQFCDALEVKNQVSSPASGWGVDHALPAWGDFWKQGYLANLCQGSDVQTCLGTYDHSNPLFTDVSIGNDYRSWSWIVCNEVGWNQEAAPTGHPTVVTRFAQPAYDERTCPYFFLSPNVANTTSAYKGWNVRVDRLFFANGIRAMRPSPQMVRTSRAHPNSPSLLMTASAPPTVDPTVKAVQVQALNPIHGWLQVIKPAKRDAKRITRLEYERGIIL